MERTGFLVIEPTDAEVVNALVPRAVKADGE